MYNLNNEKKFMKDLPFSLATGLIFGGIFLGLSRCNDYKEKKALESIKNHKGTIEHVVKKDESWDILRKRYIPYELRNKVDMHDVNEFLAKDLNGRKDYRLQENEVVMIPVYSGKFVQASIKK